MWLVVRSILLPHRCFKTTVALSCVRLIILSAFLLYIYIYIYVYNYLCIHVYIYMCVFKFFQPRVFQFPQSHSVPNNPNSPLAYQLSLYFNCVFAIAIGSRSLSFIFCFQVASNRVSSIRYQYMFSVCRELCRTRQRLRCAKHGNVSFSCPSFLVIRCFTSSPYFFFQFFR